MKKLLWVYICLTGLVVFGWANSGFASEKVRVAVIDSSFDLSLPQIAPFIDRELLASIPWYSVPKKGRITGELSSNLLEANSRPVASDPSSEEMSHGTKVSLALLRGLDPSKVTLIPIPFIPDRERPQSSVFSPLSKVVSTLSSLLQWNLFPGAVSRYFMMFFQESSRVIEDYGIMAVNLSFGFGSSISFFVSSKLRKQFNESLLKMVKSNEDTLFFQSSGNESTEIVDPQSHGNVKGRNVITVAGVDLVVGRIAPDSDSNYSALHVDASARIDSLGLGIGSIDFGTSISSPRLMGGYVGFRLNNPTDEPGLLREAFLRDGLYHSQELASHVAEGRLLIDNILTNGMTTVSLGQASQEPVEKKDSIFGFELSGNAEKQVVQIVDRLGVEWEGSISAGDKAEGLIVYYKKGWDIVSVFVKNGYVTPLTKDSQTLASAVKAVLAERGEGASGCGPAITEGWLASASQGQ